MLITVYMSVFVYPCAFFSNVVGKVCLQCGVCVLCCFATFFFYMLLQILSCWIKFILIIILNLFSFFFFFSFFNFFFGFVCFDSFLFFLLLFFPFIFSIFNAHKNKVLLPSTLQNAGSHFVLKKIMYISNIFVINFIRFLVNLDFVEPICVYVHFACMNPARINPSFCYIGFSAVSVWFTWEECKAVTD